MRNRTVKSIAAALAVLLVFALTACVPSGEQTQNAAAARAAKLSVLKTDELGDILVDGEGNVLYIFVPDKHETVSCTFTCASNWPPLTATEGDLPSADDGVDAHLIDTLPNPSGGAVVTYGGWPLYRYAVDRTPGEHHGQNAYLNGGVWLVMQPNGDPLT